MLSTALNCSQFVRIKLAACQLSLPSKFQKKRALHAGYQLTDTQAPQNTKSGILKMNQKKKKKDLCVTPTDPHLFLFHFWRLVSVNSSLCQTHRVKCQLQEVCLIFWTNNKMYSVHKASLHSHFHRKGLWSWKVQDLNDHLYTPDLHWDVYTGKCGWVGC